MRQIAELAYAVEQDRHAAYHWMCEVPIAELEGKTAVHLAFEGKGDSALRLLESVQSGGRGF